MKKQELILFMGVIGVVFILFLIFILTAFFTPSQNSPVPSSEPVPSYPVVRPFDFSPLPQASLTPLPSLPPEETRERIMNSLPFTSPLFNIEYYEDGNLYRVTIKQNPFLANQKKAKDWFEAYGLNPDTLKIYWDSYPEVER